MTYALNEDPWVLGKIMKLIHLNHYCVKLYEIMSEINE